MQLPKYRRIIIKISGEALAGGRDGGIDRDTLEKVCESVKKCYELGVQIGIVVGGGNFWRGKSSERMERTRADHIGMMATVMNALAMADALEQLGIEVRVQTALEIRAVAEPYIRNRAVRHFEKDRIVVFGCGTGNPFFSTDTAASLRAAEVGAEVILKATNTDGVYDSDPKNNPNAQKYDIITMSEVLAKELDFMDATAAAMCKENKIPVIVLNIADPENILRAVVGENVGTEVVCN